MKSVPRKVNISSDNGKLSQEPSKSFPSQNLSLKSKSIPRKLFRSFSATFLLYQESVGVYLHHLYKSKMKIQKVIRLLPRTDKIELFRQSVLLKKILTSELMIFMVLSSFIMSLISLREIAVPVSNTVCKKSIYIK